MLSKTAIAGAVLVTLTAFSPPATAGARPLPSSTDCFLAQCAASHCTRKTEISVETPFPGFKDLTWQDLGQYAGKALSLLRKNTKPLAVVEKLYDIVSDRRNELLLQRHTEMVRQELACLERLSSKLMKALIKEVTAVRQNTQQLMKMVGEKR